MMVQRTNCFVFITKFPPSILRRNLKPELCANRGTFATTRRGLVQLWVFLTLWGAALSPLGLAYARRLERQCDAFALRHASAPAGLASALAKLGESNLADPDPPRWVMYLFHAHPPLKERIARAAEALPR